MTVLCCAVWSAVPDSCLEGHGMTAVLYGVLRQTLEGHGMTVLCQTLEGHEMTVLCQTLEGHGMTVLCCRECCAGLLMVM